LFDLAREKALFHLLVILAGLFGILSAVYLEENLNLSNILDCISVHLFLLEGVLSVKRGLTDHDSWYKILIIFADSEFICGAVIDVVLSYFYLFDDTADWDVALAIVWVHSSVLWLHCSLIYVGIFVYDTLDDRKDFDETSVTMHVARVKRYNLAFTQST
jgi:hypothetical protein